MINGKTCSGPLNILSSVFKDIPVYPGDSCIFYFQRLANSDDPDEMPHSAAFHLGKLCLLDENNLQRKEIQFLWGIIASDPTIYTMDHPIIIVSNQKEESLTHKLKRMSILVVYMSCFY